MNDSRISTRYARALYTLAQDGNLTEAVRDDLRQLSELRQKSAEFRVLLETPVLMVSQKAHLFRTILEGSVGDLTLQFILLLVNHKRESYLPVIIRVFMDLYKAGKGILEATVLTASPVQPEIMATLRSKIAEYSDKKIELTHEIREEIIGGFILSVEDQQLDASVVAQLKRIKQELHESKK